MNRTRVKICGITRTEDALAAAHAGADAIGLVFFAGSPRAITLARAAALCAALPPFISKVGLFVNAPAEEVQAVTKNLSLDLLQFHGEESPEFCAQFKQPFIKAVRVKPGMDLVQYASLFKLAQGLLLDAFHESAPGGTGITFDWNLIPTELELPIILSGGLNANNVAAAIGRVNPWAVDVSSGVEEAKGIKNAAKMAAFITEVRRADI